MRHLTLVVCGAPLAARVDDLVSALTAADWNVTVAPTGSARPWLDRDFEAGGFRRPGTPKPPRPDALVVCPMTFNTGNKWIQGHADSRPLALLCESLGARKPIVAVPFVNRALWGHPTWRSTLAELAAAGVVMLDPGTGDRDPRPLQDGEDDRVAAGFDPSWVVRALPAARSRPPRRRASDPG